MNTFDIYVDSGANIPRALQQARKISVIPYHFRINGVEPSCVDESVQRFAKGYETLVGERGVTLSGGQKQRVAIARMLVQDTPIMIFDDSLSAVDTETDERIRRALKKYLGQATVILISHRISTLMDADQIIVLDGGRIVQQGTHEKLRNQEGIYREIYKIQSPDEEVAV